jgi:hypothetical protein
LLFRGLNHVPVASEAASLESAASSFVSREVEDVNRS